MTGVLVAALVLIVAAAGALAWSAARSAAFYLRCWVRLTALCVSLGVYDSHRQAERASHTSGGHRTAPPERGSVWPSLATLDRLPVRYRVVGRIVQHDDRLDQLVAQFAHFTGRPWTWRRRPLSRVIELAQALALPEIPAHPEPMTLTPWVLPVGETRTGPALWDTTVAANCLVVAAPRWRKSSFAAWLAGYCRRMRHWTVVTIDPEHSGPSGWLVTLKRIKGELDRRDPDAIPLHRWLVVVDEFDDVMKRTTRADDDHDVRRQVRSLVWELLRHGGKRGLHTLALVQDPRAEAIGSGIRSKFTARAAGWLDLDEARLVCNRSIPHAIDGPPGRGWWLVPETRPAEAQFHAIPIQQEQKTDPRYEEPPTTRVTRIFPALGSRDARR